MYARRTVHLLAISIVSLLWAGVMAEGAQWPKTLAGLKFQSVKQFAIGELPTGPVYGYRTIFFQKDGTLTYQQSDAVYLGQYVWNSKNGQLSVKLSGGNAFKARIDPKSGVLLWEGVQYKVLKPKA